MDVTAVDRSAVSGTSALHRADPAVKLLATGLVLASVVVSNDPVFVTGVALVLVAATSSLRLPLRSMLPLALYPALFALVFAFAAAPGPVVGALFVVKAVTAAFAMLALMFTTPYPQVFAPLQRVTPVIVGDVLLMTYRSLFILADKFADLVRAVRLRAGVSARQPIRSAKATTRALGGLLLYSFDLSQREYDVLRLRGYEGRLRVTPQESRSRAADAGVLALGLVVLGMSIGFRALPGLADYSWLVAAAGVLALVASLLVGWRTQ